MVIPNLFKKASESRAFENLPHLSQKKRNQDKTRPD
jgi:hypothetical protein